MRRATQMSKDNWDKRFTANAVNAYIRDGFSVVGENTDTSIVPLLPPNTIPVPAQSTTAVPGSTTPATSVPSPTNNPFEDNQQVPETNKGSEEESDTIAPRVILQTNKRTIMQGESIVLSWSTQQATQCTASDGWSGSKAKKGRETLSLRQVGETTFTLRCTKGNEYDTDEVSVMVLSANTQAPNTNLNTNMQTSSVYVGLRVMTNDNVRVRQSANGPVLTIKNRGAIGTVTTKPKLAGNYEWAYVDFADGTDGYVAVLYLSPQGQVTTAQNLANGPSNNLGNNEKRLLLERLQTELILLLQKYVNLLSQ